MCKALAKWCDEYKDESGTGPTLREPTSSVEIHLVYKYLVTKSNIRKYTVGLLSARVGVKGVGSMGGVRSDRVVAMGVQVQMCQGEGVEDLLVKTVKERLENVWPELGKR